MTMKRKMYIYSTVVSANREVDASIKTFKISQLAIWKKVMK